jgi:hypothetical protein
MVALRSGSGWFTLIASFSLTLVLADMRPSEAADTGIAFKPPPSEHGEVELEGGFVIIHQDFKHTGRYLYFLDTPQGRLSLRFAKNPPTHLLTGARVHVRGSKRPDGTLLLALGGGKSVTTTTNSSTMPLPNTFGAQSTVVILVNFQDAPANQPYTVADAQSVVFGTTNNFLLENSYQQTWLRGHIVGWYTIPMSSTTCDTFSIASYAKSAAVAARIDLSAYTHFVYAFPQNNNCGWGVPHTYAEAHQKAGSTALMARAVWMCI